MAESDKKPGRSKDSLANTLTVAIGVSLVSSILVAGTAVLLKPKQEENRTRFRQQIVLEVAGLFEPGDDIEALFADIETRVVDLETGNYVDSIDPETLGEPTDPAPGVAIPDDVDIAGVGSRPVYAPVYIVRDGGEITQVILPVYGAGLWSTMYGYLSLAGDGNTVRGLRFYEHAETPGLGDQIERPEWLDQWPGKKLYGPDGRPRVEVVRGRVAPGDDASYQVDGLSGATLTGRGVTNLLRYWAGPHGYGPYLDRLSREATGDD